MCCAGYDREIQFVLGVVGGKMVVEIRALGKCYRMGVDIQTFRVILAHIDVLSRLGVSLVNFLCTSLKDHKEHDPI
jgi:hypothetical protein